MTTDDIARCMGQSEDEVCPFRKNCLRYSLYKFDVDMLESYITVGLFIWQDNNCEHLIKINNEI
jgi:hypothetical protein